MTAELQVLTSQVLREAYGMFPSGVTGVCALVEGSPLGMAASSFTSVSMDPPLVSICVAQTSNTWRRLRETPSLGVSVMSESHRDTARQLGSRGPDKFSGVSWEPTPRGAVLLHGSTLWLECRIDQEVRAGDHDIVVLAVDVATAHPGTTPLLFHASTLRGLPNPAASPDDVGWTFE